MREESAGRFAEIARSIGPGLAARAAAHDREGSFVTGNYADLKEARLLSAGVPEELGGGGASLGELCAMLRELGRHCPSTALALSMHTHLVASAVWRHRHGQPAAALLERVAKGELVLVSTGAGDWLESNGSSERVEGGFRVTAQKRFASGCPVGDLALTSAPWDDPEAGPQVLHFAVPLSAPGVKVGTDWDTLGMRGTGSHTLSFEGVFVPDAAVTMRRPRGVWHPVFDVISTVACPIFASAYMGLTDAAADHAIGAARGRASDPVLPFVMGELRTAHVTARLAWERLVALGADYDFLPDNARTDEVMICKAVMSRAVRECLDKAVESTGGGAYYRRNLLERLWRDAQAMQFHPLQEKRQLLFTGRLALGLPPM